jgi:hypothetical protein
LKIVATMDPGYNPYHVYYIYTASTEM